MIPPAGVSARSVPAVARAPAPARGTRRSGGPLIGLRRASRSSSADRVARNVPSGGRVTRVAASPPGPWTVRCSAFRKASLSDSFSSSAPLVGGARDFLVRRVEAGQRASAGVRGRHRPLRRRVLIAVVLLDAQPVDDDRDRRRTAALGRRARRPAASRKGLWTPSRTARDHLLALLRCARLVLDLEIPRDQAARAADVRVRKRHRPDGRGTAADAPRPAQARQPGRRTPSSASWLPQERRAEPDFFRFPLAVAAVRADLPTRRHRSCQGAGLRAQVLDELGRRERLGVPAVGEDEPAGLAQRLGRQLQDRPPSRPVSIFCFGCQTISRISSETSGEKRTRKRNARPFSDEEPERVAEERVGVEVLRDRVALARHARALDARRGRSS